MVDAGTDRTVNRLSSVMLPDDANPYRRAPPCRFDRCRFPQPAVIGGTFACTQPCRILRARLLTGFNPTRDGLVFFHGPLPIPTPGLSLLLNPSFARGWYIDAILRLFAGQFDGAIECAEASLRLSPRGRFGQVFNVIGAALLFSRRFEEAAPKLLLATQDDPSLYSFATAPSLHARCGQYRRCWKSVALAIQAADHGRLRENARLAADRDTRTACP